MILNILTKIVEEDQNNFTYVEQNCFNNTAKPKLSANRKLESFEYFVTDSRIATIYFVPNCQSNFSQI